MELEKFKKAPLFMDERKDRAVTAARGAINVNLRKLWELAIRTGKLIAGLCAFHDKPANFQESEKSILMNFGAWKRIFWSARAHAFC